jgi:2,4-dienoyl-CoA reductase-like NADH-dependent reductase (Old Yellow Enzyme family)
MQFPLAVVQAVREVWPDDKPLLCRISCVDGLDIGWTLSDSIILAKHLKAAGVDVIDCSSGGMNLPTKEHLLPRRPGFQVPFATTIREQADIPTMAVGLIAQAHQANSIIEHREADLVALARELLWNPNWALHAGQTLDHDPSFNEWPHQSGWWLARRRHSMPRNTVTKHEAE